MKLNLNFLVGLTLGVLLVGCAGVSFPYKWYYPELTSYQGTLLGTKPAEDLDASICAKDDQGEHGCVVMIKKEFKAMTLDYLDTKQKLIDCEHGITK